MGKTKLAYFLGGRIPHRNPDFRDNNPLPEFLEFQNRTGAEAYDFNELDQAPRGTGPHHWPEGVRFALLAHRLRARFDASVASGEDIGLPMALRDALAWRRRPLCVITHGSFLASERWRRASTVLRRLRHVHWACLSQSLADCLIKDFQFPASQVHNAGYGVDTRFFQPTPATPDPRSVVAAGTASRDYRTLVDACRGLDLSLRIAADSAWFPAEVDVAKEDLPRGIEIGSAGNYQGLKALYANASFVVVPLKPVRHACGYAVIIEAMAMGKAVISTRTPSVSDFIVDGRNGFLVEPGDADTLRQRIEHLLRHPDLARSLGEQARRDCEEHWSLPAYCQRLEAVVAAALPPRRASPRPGAG